VLHSFGSAGDGSVPEAGLIAVNGVLYGTTTGGGSPGGSGTVFSITPSGKETVLHTFFQESSEGFSPQAPLVNLNGTLYGTLFSGGANQDGAVFAITPSGSETQLYSFLGNEYSDAAWPVAGLTAVNGVLYGTTLIGGAAFCSQNNAGCGTVYSITTTGVESVLYSFTNLSSGVYPQTGLIDVNGALYGTTQYTIFKMTTSGQHTVLHHFYRTNGAYPEGNLMHIGGVFYGTTANNGPGESGNGTVFSLAL